GPFAMARKRPPDHVYNVEATDQMFIASEKAAAFVLGTGTTNEGLISKALSAQASLVLLRFDLGEQRAGRRGNTCENFLARLAPLERDLRKAYVDLSGQDFVLPGDA